MHGLDYALDRKDVVVATWRGAIVTVLREGATAEMMLAVRGVVDRFAKARGDRGYVSATVLDVHVATQRSEDAREATMALNRDFASYVRAGAFVIPGGGFAGATLRMMLSTIFLLTRSTYPTKTFESSRDAAAWLAGYGEKHPGNELHAFIEAARRRASTA